MSSRRGAQGRGGGGGRGGRPRHPPARGDGGGQQRSGGQGGARGGDGGHSRGPGDRIVYGRNPVRELVRAARRPVHRVWVAEQLAEAAWLEGVDVRTTGSEHLYELAGTGDHQGVVAECGPYPYVGLEELVGREGVVVVLDEIADPRNVGAIARTAEATGAVGLVIPERRSAQVTATVCKTSTGAVEHLPVARVRNITDALVALKQGGAWTYGAAMDGPPYTDTDLSGPVALVLGGEGRGLRRRVAETCDGLISLPMRGHVDSLNVSAAAAVLLYAAMGAQRKS